MEEKKQKNQQSKLTYEELSQRFGDLYAQYQKATAYIQKLEAALSEDAFNKTSFFISMLFKVIEHPEEYSPEFVKWSVENIESCLKTFAESFRDPEEEKKEEK